MWVNGVGSTAQTVSGTPQSSASYPLTIGGYYNGNGNFYISDIRILKGTAQYTTTFTPPTAPLTAITNTSLLLNATNAGIYDQTAKNDITTYGSAAISTTQSKFGGSSMYFDGSTGYLTTPSNSLSLYSFGTGDFTVEFWLYSNDTSGGIVCPANAFGTGYWGLGINASNLIWQSSSGVTNLLTNSATSILNNAWHHVAVVRSSGTLKMYFDGVAQSTTVSDSTNYTFASSGLQIGSDSIQGSSGMNVGYLSGYIDDLRITKYARYTANFTPPTSAFANQ